MKGLELAELYYKEHGAAMMEESFPRLVSRAAVGLSGEGSECLGFDDEVSRDHDFSPSFCIWLTDGDYEEYSFRLSRAYSALPREFHGVKRDGATPTGGARRGVMRTSDFYRKFLGSPSSPATAEHWLAIPEYALAAATSGKVFRDDLGEFSAVRETLLRGYPDDVKFKKAAAYFITAAQSGEYNYERCLAHGESGAAQLAIFTYVKNILAAIYLLNGRYMPFYKWAFRGAARLPVLSNLTDVLEFLISSGNEPNEANAKRGIIGDVSRAVLTEAHRLGFTDGAASLEKAAYEANGKVSSPTLRNESVFAGMIKE